MPISETNAHAPLRAEPLGVALEARIPALSDWRSVPGPRRCGLQSLCGAGSGACNGQGCGGGCSPSAGAD